jgi:hypothetical protein
VLYNLLPDLQHTGPAFPDAFALSMSTGSTSIVMEMHADRRARDTRAAEAQCKKTFYENYGDCITDSILLLTMATNDNFLPA